MVGFFLEVRRVNIEFMLGGMLFEYEGEESH